MAKFAQLILALLLVLAVVALGLYGAGVLGDDYVRVDRLEHETGGFSFSGYLQDGTFAGHGQIEFDDGSSYSGHFSEGRFNGEGIFRSSADAEGGAWRFEGIFLNGQPNSGMLHLPDGSEIVIEGGMTNIDAPEWEFIGRVNEQGQTGEGVFTFEDGSVYTGSFVNGLANGNGTLVDAQGNEIFTGQFVDGYFHGIGTYFSSEGWSFEGNFQSGTFHGEGSFIDGDTIIRGVWESGVQTVRYE